MEIKKRKEDTSIAKKVIFLVIFSGLIVSIIGTSLSLRRDYLEFKKNLRERFANVEKTNLEALGRALFYEDDSQLDSQIKGILATPDFIYVHVKSFADEKGEIRVKAGKMEAGATITDVTDILVPEEERDANKPAEKIGQLKMVASLKGITEKMREQVLVFALIQGIQFLLITLIIYSVFRKYVSSHLQKMAHYAENFSLDDLQVGDLTLEREEQKKSDELEKLVDSFNKMKKNLQISHEKLRDYAENLEDKVKEATQEIEEEKDKVSNLLNNMKQAIFCVNGDWNVIPPVSSFTDTCFSHDILGKDIFKTLYKDVDLASEDYANLFSAYSVIFGANSLQWEMVEDHLLSKIHYNIYDSKGFVKEVKTFSVNYIPLWDENELLEKIMFNVEDVTEREKLEKEIKKEKKSNEKNISIITEMANAEIEDVENFLINARSLIDDTMALAKNPKSEKDNSVKNMFRFLHTLKGNARAFNFESISSLTHITESQVKEIQENKGDHFDKEDVGDLIDNLYFLRQEINDYGNLAKKVFRLENEFGKKLLKETHGYLTDLDNLICINLTNSEKKLSSNESIKGRREEFNKIKSKELTEEFKVQLKRTTHSLKGCLRSSSSLSIVREKVQNFETSFSLLEKLDDISLDDFSTRFIDNFIEIKDQVKTVYMQSDLNKPFAFTKSEWAELFNNIYKLTVSFKESKRNREYNLALGALIEQANKMDLLFVNKIAADLKGLTKLEDSDNIKSLFEVLWRYCSLISYLEFSKVKDHSQRKKYIEGFEKVINDEGKKLSEIESSILELDHEIILHSVLDIFIKNEIKPSYFFLEASKWLGSQDFYKLDSGLDIFLFNSSENPKLSLFRVELKTARITNNLPSKIKSLAHQGDPLAGVMELFFKNVDYYYYMKLIDFYQLVNGFFIEKQGDMNIKKVETWPVVMRNIKKLEKIIEEGNIDRIKKAVQKLKDIPILPQMSKFKTMIDDIALKLSKSVDFILDGDGVAMNKESYNLLQDAMVHILRNALDHGLELPKERQEMGKNPKGTIKVRCKENLADDSIEITIEDDGKGIDPQLIGKKAVQKGLLTEDQLKKMSDEEIIKVIFTPNFSQKDTVDELSGRGIGMDIVKENVNKIGGEVFVESKFGSGTVFVIKINDNKG